MTKASDPIMTLSLNSGALTIDETSIQTGDETAASSASFFDSGLKTKYDAYGSTSQEAVQQGLFAPAAMTTDLTFSKSATAQSFSTTDGVDSGLKTASGTSIFFFQGTDNDIIVGRAGNNASGDAVLVIALDEKVSGGLVTDTQLWIKQYAPIQHGATGSPTDLVQTLANKLYATSTETQLSTPTTAGAPSGQSNYVMLANSGGDSNINVLTTAYKVDTGANANVNVSTTGLGVASQAVDAGEALRVDLVHGGTVGGGVYSGIAYTGGHAESTAFSFTFSQVQSGGGGTPKANATFKLFNVNDNGGTSNNPEIAQGANFVPQTTGPGGVAPVSIEGLTIKDASGAILYNGGLTSAGTAAGLGVSVSGNTANLTGVQVNYSVSIQNTAGNVFDRIAIENSDTSGSAKFDINGMTFVGPPTQSTTSVEVGSKIEIIDGAPTITAPADAVPLSVADGGDSNSAEPSFSTNFGPDGPSSSSPLSYSLRIDSTATGLKSGGLDVVLWKDSSGVVHGSTTSGNAATDVFTVGTTSGVAFAELTMLAGKAVDHAVGVNTATISGALSLVATATDRDGDTASAARPLTLSFSDAAPSITAGSAVALSSTDGSSATDSAPFAFSGESYGADGAGTTTTALEIVNAATGLKSGGVNIILEPGAGGSIVGKAGGATIFTVTLDGDNVKLTQTGPIDHAAGSGLATLTGALKVTRTVTDRDGDAKSASNEVNLSFNDGVPTIAAGTAVNLESTDGSTATDAKAFSFTLQSYGPDGAGTTTDALVITNANTGLTSGGTAVVLSMDGANVVGMAGSTKVFTVSLSGTNVVLDQDAPIDHTPGQDTLQISGVRVQRTVTDRDGDQEIASTGINLTFNDTNPTITAGSAVSLTSTDGSSATDSKAFSFTGESYGGDTGGTTTTSLEILTAATGLTSGGKPITLETSGGSIVGKADGNVVFTVSLSGNNVTLSQSMPLDNATADAVLNGAISIKRTVTDGDGDTTSASNAVNLTFKDVDPTVTGATAMSLTTSDATLATDASATSGITHTLGADGGTFAYSLEGSGATTLTTGGKAISLAVVGGNVVGQVAGGGTAFTVSVDSAGQVTLDQKMAIDHTTDTISLNGAISLVGTATDGDGDKATGKQDVNLTFTDDKPTITLSGTSAGTLSTSDGKLNAASTAVNFATLFGAASYGADAPGSTELAFKVNTAASGLKTVNDKAVTLSVADGGKTLVGTEADTGAKAFVVNLDTATGDATMTQLIAIKHAANTSEAVLSSGLVSIVATAKDYDGDTAEASVNIGSSFKFLDVTPEFVDPTPAGSADGVDDIIVQYKNGVVGQDTFTVDFHNDVPGTSVSFNAFDAVSQNGLKANQTSATHIDYVRSLDPLTKALYSLDIASGSYSVTVGDVPVGTPQMIAFDKLPSGSPLETITADLTGELGGKVKIDGLIFNKAVLAQNSNPMSQIDTKADPTADDINVNNIGFGIKGGQASQINPGEGFRIDYIAPTGTSNSSLLHTTKMSFDVYGVGNLENVKVHYWLYRDGGILVDEGYRSTSEHMNPITGLVDKTGLSLRDNNAHNIVIFDDGAAGGGGSVAGDYFDYAIIAFEFPTNQANQGIRVGTFFTEVNLAPDPDAFNFELKATDVDGDVALSGNVQVILDPTLLSSTGWVFA